MLIKTKIFPKSKKATVIARDAETFHIYTREPAELGRATADATRLLAEHLNVSENKLRLLRGHATPNKLFELME